MNVSIRVASKVYYRSPLYSVIFAVLVCISNLYLSKLSITALSLAEYHLGSLKLGIVGYITFCFLSYEYLGRVSNCGIKETVISIDGAETKLFFSQCLIIFGLLFLWCINIYGWIVVAYMRFQTQYVSFLLHALFSVILDLLLPGVIAISLGAVLTLSMKREIAYCVITIAALLCSPVPSKLLANEAIWGHSILSLLDWFAILAPNTAWVADVLYGVSIELCRWVLAIFWVCLLLAIALCRISSNTRKRRILVALSVVAVAICGIRFLSRGNDSVVRKDYRPEGTLNGEYSFRKNSPLQETSAPNFSVDCYHINLTIKNNMKAEVAVEVADNTLNELCFTLFHSFDVESIECTDGEPLDFDRCGDYITVYAPAGTRELHFRYSGNVGKYYANYQGIALPGYIPYYPIPGHVKLWEPLKNEVVVNTNRETSFFEIQVDSALNVFSNLESTGENSFTGYSNAVSLYAGMLVPSESNGVTYFVSPIGHQSLDLSKYQQTWNEIAAKVGESSTLNLSGKVIFLQPFTIMAANAPQEAYAEFDDHIIVGAWMPSAEDICYGYLRTLIPQSSSTDMLRTTFLDYLIFGGVANSNRILWDEVEILARYDSANEITDSNEWFAYVEATNKFTELLNYKIYQLGEDTVLKAVYQYLLNPTIQQVDFLYNLGE